MQINAQLVFAAMLAGSAAAAPLRLPGSSKKPDTAAADGAAAPAKPGFAGFYDTHGSKINAVGAIGAGSMAIGAGVITHETNSEAANEQQQAQSSDPAAAVRRAMPHRADSLPSGGASRPPAPQRANSAPPAMAGTSNPPSSSSSAGGDGGKASTDEAAAKAKNGAWNNGLGTAGMLVGGVGGAIALDNAVDSNNAQQQSSGDPAANVRRSPLTPVNIAGNLGLGLLMGGGPSFSNTKQSSTQQGFAQGASHTGASSRRSIDHDLLGKRLFSSSSTEYDQTAQGMEQGAQHTGASSGGNMAASAQGRVPAGAGSGFISSVKYGRRDMAKRLFSFSNDHQDYTTQMMQQGPKHTGASSGASLAAMGI